MSSIFIGFDPREVDAFAVARKSCRKYLTQPIPIHGLVLDQLRIDGLYKREMTTRDGVMWDVLSDAPQSTEHANSRFFVPLLAKKGWALFCDGDVLFRDNVGRVFDGLDPHYAVYCVKHHHQVQTTTKMDNQIQLPYSRKNWSSFMIFNCDHEANKALTLEMLNLLPGRDLHRFCWLDDSEIGEIDPRWNYLVDSSPPIDNPAMVHFTNGTPAMKGYENQSFADEWRAMLRGWAT